MARYIALISEGVSQKTWIVICGIRSVSAPLGAGVADAASASSLTIVSGAGSAGARAVANREVIIGLAASI